MKIFFINRSDVGGGTANFAWRLANELSKKYKTNNYFAVEVKRTNNNFVYKTRKNGLERIFDLSINKIFNMVGLQYYFIPFSTSRIFKCVKDICPDIISVHSIHGGYFQTSLLSKLSKIAPIVWTISDMWPVTRNAAHTFGNENWKNRKTFNGENKIYPQIGFNNGGINFKHKERIYKKSNIVIVGISKWITKICKESPLLKDKKIEHIYSGINLKSFRKINKVKARKKLNLEINEKVIMFGADFLSNNPWKGGNLLTDVLNEIDNLAKDKITLFIVGKGGNNLEKKYKYLKVKYFGYVKDELMPVCYSAADCFINPTRADSLSLVLVESTSCGTPCVTYKVGGTSEVIINGKNGYSVEFRNAKSFASKVMKILKNEKLRSNMSKFGVKFANNNFSIKDSATSYYHLFKNLKNEKKL